MKSLILAALTCLFVFQAFPQNHNPVANLDMYSLMELEPVELDILSNDTDPEGDEFKIYHVSGSQGCEASMNTDSTKVIVTPSFSIYNPTMVSYTIIEKNTPEKLISNPTKVYIKIHSNPDIPVLIPDTAYTTGGSPVTIPVLDNDYDRQGEAFEIFTNTYPGEGTLIQDGDNFIFTPYISREGTSQFTYRVRESYDPVIYTQNTRVRITVSKNPDCPVGIADHASGVTAQPMIINAISNDYDPQGELIEIYDVDSEGEATIEDNEIHYTSSPYAIGHDTLYYRIRQVDHHEYYSRNTPVYIDMAVNPELPVAVDDYVTGNIYYPVTVAPMANDIPNSADSLVFLLPYNPSDYVEIIIISDSLFTCQALTNAPEHATIEYIIRDKHNPELTANGRVYVDISDHHYYDSLVINKINAGVNADGMLFADVGQLPGQGIKSNAFNHHFKYPSGEETSTIFNSMIWIAGNTDDDSLHFAGEHYRQDGADFQPGPVSNVYDSLYALKYWRLWKLSKAEIEYHRANWQAGSYIPPEDIATWPGNGDIAQGQAAQMAPYQEINANGIYEPGLGEYPLIRGDQAIFFMMNDDKEHTESLGNKLKVEIHGMVYAYDTPDDSVLSHTIFVHYDVINCSDKTYYDSYAGIWTDFDIGAWFDDYVGSDVGRASYFGYNGDGFDNDYLDPIFEIPGYGAEPPAQSVTILAGPVMNADGLDNPSGGCDYSVNGLNFGNGIADDERLGMTGFMFKVNSGSIPALALDSYNYLRSYWEDGSKLQFGGFGNISVYDPLTVGPDCNFYFPGASDTLNFGTGCISPNPPYDQDGFYWTDSNTFSPGDRSGLGSMGPFTFAPGDVQEIDLAYVVANGWDGPVSSVNTLMEYIDTLRYRVSQGEIIIPNDQLGVSDFHNDNGKMKIFPNPAINRINIKIDGNENFDYNYIIYDVFGRSALQGNLTSSHHTVDISHLKDGFYVITIKSAKTVYSGKFIKH